MPRVELTSTRRDFIADLAETVWCEYSRERQTYLDGIAERWGLTISYGNYADAFDGLLEHKHGTFHIYCNLTRVFHPCAPRARFTLAHELGHFFIDEHRNALASGKPPHASFPERPTNNPVEKEANVFASHLLMPTVEFQAALAEASKGLQGIVDIASTFGVSIQSAALRYSAASGKPCAIVMFREGKYPWWDISPEMKPRSLICYERLNCGFLEDSATSRALRDDPTKLGIPHTTNTFASDWFEDIAKESADDFALVESAIRLKSRGVLTLLAPIS